MNSNAPPTASLVWKGIVKAKNALRDGFQVDLGSSDFSVWYKDWSGLGKLCLLLPFVHVSDTHMQIHHLWKEGMWDFSILATPIPEAILDGIRSICVPSTRSTTTAHWRWTPIPDGRPLEEGTSVSPGLARVIKRRKKRFFTACVIVVLLMQDDILLAVDESVSVPHLWWVPPAIGQWKLNVDGCLDIQSRITSSGGVLRDALGAWNCSYSCRENAGSGASNSAAHPPQFRSLQPCRDTLVEIITLLKRRWDVQVKFIFREANCVANSLAKLGRSSAIEFTRWDFPPPQISNLLLKDFAL
ncbi:Reverse transcriptase-like [Sesbania bispinosa]|nr:Reverse transcriptase-like [Sesbania bispinosa]